MIPIKTMVFGLLTLLIFGILGFAVILGAILQRLYEMGDNEPRSED